MPTRLDRRWLRHPVPAALSALALMALLLDAGSVPHVHAGDESGLYSQECGLSYLATFRGSALLPESVSPGPLAVIVVAAVASSPSHPALAPRRHADSRAPPLV
ncbi:MAG: hypothetical protein HY728_01800 [Candidatus Rokubacteria bacterium]|nr:hypothetical protein [Candidatus Rokubacteria bacterium]